MEKPLGTECLDISRVYYIFATLDWVIIDICNMIDFDTYIKMGEPGGKERAGILRDYEISKKEWVLDGASYAHSGSM